MLKVCFTSVSQVVVVTKKINAREESNSVVLSIAYVWKLSKGGCLNVYVAVFEDIWFGKGQRLHVIDYLIPYIPEVQIVHNRSPETTNYLL